MIRLKSLLKFLPTLLLLAAGAALCCLYPPMRFSGGICLGLAGLSLVYILLAALQDAHPKAVKRCRWALGGCLAVGVLIVSITLGFVLAAAAGDAGEQCAYIVVLGAAVHGNTPSLTMTERCEAARDYLEANPDTLCVVSGGVGEGESVSEAQAMYSLLTAMGIDGGRIYMEDKATSTWENIRFSLDLLEEQIGVRPETIGIVSSEYHLCRAELFASENGVQSVGIPGTTANLPLRINYFLREVAGIWHYILLGGY